MKARQEEPKSTTRSREGMRELRTKRQREGWQRYEGWLEPETAGLMEALRRTDQDGPEPLYKCIGRAFQALAQAERGGFDLTQNPKAWEYHVWEFMQDLKQLGPKAIVARLHGSRVPTPTGLERWDEATVSKWLRKSLTRPEIVWHEVP